MSGVLENSLISEGIALSSSQIPTAAQDVVGVFDNDLNQLFVNARPIKASVRETDKFMKHPSEIGITITDHRIFNPLSITLSIIVNPENFADTYQQVRSANQSLTPLVCLTKVGSFDSLFITEYPHEEDVAHFDTITLVIKLEQVIFVQSQTTQLPPGSTTTSRGNKTAKAATPTQTNQAAGDGVNSWFFNLGKGAGAI